MMQYIGSGLFCILLSLFIYFVFYKKPKEDKLIQFKKSDYTPPKIVKSVATRKVVRKVKKIPGK